MQLPNSTANPVGWPGPLGGIKVIDLTRVLAGPFMTQILGDLGAEILKIETPGYGDETRTFAPKVEGESHYFMALNRQKKSLVIDLQKPKGADILRKLIANADVLVENFRPGVMARLGFDNEAVKAINPRLINCSISGFGMTGPLKDKPSFDIVTQAMGGVMSVNGSAGALPVKLGIPMGDMVGGIFGSIGVLSALLERQTTGTGRLVDISLHDGMLGMLGYLSQIYFITGKDPKPVGTRHPNIVPYGDYPARDGQIIIACLMQSFWPKLCVALDCPQLNDDPRFNTVAARLINRLEVDHIISDITSQQTVDYWVECLTKHDVPHAPVLSIGSALEHPQSIARDMVVKAMHPLVGEIQMVGRPIKFPGSPQIALNPPPVLGQHTREILSRELNLSSNELDILTKEGVIDRID